MFAPEDESRIVSGSKKHREVVVQMTDYADLINTQRVIKVVRGWKGCGVESATEKVVPGGPTSLDEFVGEAVGVLGFAKKDRGSMAPWTYEAGAVQKLTVIPSGGVVYFAPTLEAAQVVHELYRHKLERNPKRRAGKELASSTKALKAEPAIVDPGVIAPIAAAEKDKPEAPIAATETAKPEAPTAAIEKAKPVPVTREGVSISTLGEYALAFKAQCSANKGAVRAEAAGKAPAAASYRAKAAALAAAREAFRGANGPLLLAQRGLRMSRAETLAARIATDATELATLVADSTIEDA